MRSLRIFLFAAALGLAGGFVMGAAADNAAQAQECPNGNCPPA